MLLVWVIAALVVWALLVRISGMHAPTASTADREALKERLAVARSTLALEGFVVVRAVLVEPLQILHVDLPGDVPSVGIAEQRLPLIAGNECLASSPNGAVDEYAALLSSSVDVGAGVDRVLQNGENAGMRERLPPDLGRSLFVGVARGELQLVLRKVSNDRVRGPIETEAIE
jgi:hypothetical protein